MKTIRITKSISEQNKNCKTFTPINGSMDQQVRMDLIESFCSGDINNISITHEIATAGGIDWNKCKKPVSVEFMYNVSEEEKADILSRMNLKK